MTLRARGVRTVGPDVGQLACGWEGAGRMSDPAEIAQTAELVLGSCTLEGEAVLVTAAGTREAVDAVRYLGNRSSTAPRSIPLSLQRLYAQRWTYS